MDRTALHRFLLIMLSTAALGLRASAATIDTARPARMCPYVITAANEPQLSHEQLVALLRKHIKYVFVLYQENRSFNTLFRYLPRGERAIFGRPVRSAGIRHAGFDQPLMNIDGSADDIQPFRIGPAEFAADTDDVDHSHAIIAAKMHILNGTARMDRYAVTEERKYAGEGLPTIMAKQFGELTMAYEDCDTVPFLWRYADRFTLMDNVFQSIAGPSTPGNLDIIAAQTGATQWVEHPDQGYAKTDHSGPGEPVTDADPYWGSPYDQHGPVNPFDFSPYNQETVQYNQTYASLPLTLAGKNLQSATKKDELPDDDLDDVKDDIVTVTKTGHAPVDWRWYEEGFDKEPAAGADPLDAGGLHASYITHHNGPQYFGYVSNNPEMRKKLRGLGDFYADVAHGQPCPKPAASSTSRAAIRTSQGSSRLIAAWRRPF